jgi:hypothetical protein
MRALIFGWPGKLQRTWKRQSCSLKVIGITMRVPDEVLKCVGFIGEVVRADSSGVEGDLCATGFFVAIPCETPGLQAFKNIYFVTAKHVVDSLHSREAFLLVNKRSGGIVERTGIQNDLWFFHPSDKTADVAVVPINPGPESDVIGISIDHFGLPEIIKKHAIGIGDEVVTVGLFTAVPGISKNQPILRYGNIAMLPVEQIQTELGYADVILVEARSIGGISGSPVFVRHTYATQVKNKHGEYDMLFANSPAMTLLGLMHGHWDIKESELNRSSIIHDRQRGVNMGIAMVVPAAKIYETLYAPELVEIRKENEQKLLKQGIPGMDSESP